MKTIKTRCLLLSFTLLTSCMTTPFFPRYHISGDMDGTRKFHGEMYNEFFDGKMYVNIDSDDGRMHCSGPMIPSHQPIASFTCDTAEGSIEFSCTENHSKFYNVIQVNWVADGCDKGSGFGYEENGHVLHYNYYLSR